MSSTHVIRMGDKGRAVVPADIRERLGWSEGTRLIALEGSESHEGVLLLSQHAALKAIRSQLAGHDPVADLLADRRAAAAQEDTTR